MNELVGVLERVAGGADGSWNVENTSAVIKIRAESQESFDDAASAFAESQRILRLILDAGFVLVNRAEFGVKSEPIFTGNARWRGTIDSCVWMPKALTENHQRIERALVD